MRYIRLFFLMFVFLFSSVAQTEEMEDLIELGKDIYFIKGSETTEGENLVGFWCLSNDDKPEYKSLKAHYVINCKNKRKNIDALYFYTERMGHGKAEVFYYEKEKWTPLLPNNSLWDVADILCNNLLK